MSGNSDAWIPCRLFGPSVSVRVHHRAVLARTEMRGDADDAVGTQRQTRKEEVVVARPNDEIPRRGRAESSRSA